MNARVATQILLQPWREMCQAKRGWLLLTAFLSAVFLLGLALRLRGVSLAYVVLIGSICIFVLSIWLQFVWSALKQSSFSGAGLIPGFQLRLASVIVITYLTAITFIGSIALQLSGSIALSVYSLSMAGLLLAVLALGMASQVMTWIVILFIGGMQITGVQQALELFYRQASQWQTALMVVVVGAGSLAVVFSRQRTKRGPWSLLPLRADSQRPHRSSSYIYCKALASDIATGNPRRLVQHALGPAGHWTVAFLSAPVLVILFCLLQLNDRNLWGLAIFVPVMCCFATQGLRNAMYETRTEQQLVSLVPTLPPSRELNNLLLTSHVRTFAAVLGVVAALSWITHVAKAPSVEQTLLAFAMLSALPAAIPLLTDYSRLEAPSFLDLLVSALYSAVPLVLLYVINDLRPQALPWVASGLVLITGALFVIRWQAVVRATIFFPTARSNRESNA